MGGNEINQPMYATAVGLIIRGFEHLETYKKSFQAGTKEDYVKVRKPVIEKVESPVEEELEAEPDNLLRKKYLSPRRSKMISRMFEVEDQKIN